MNTEPTPPTLVPFSATCKFCGVALNCMVDPDGVTETPTKSCIKFSSAFLRAVACCNRCRDALVTQWRVEDRLKRNADKLLIARANGRDGGVVDEVRAGFERTTRWWIAWLCRQYRLSDFWDETFVHTLVEKPQHYQAVARMMRQTVERLAVQTKK